MRIISGKLKGLMFSPPKNLPVRPTTDFAKTGIFNILSNNFDLENITVLEIFSGTGNITLEFLSRGAMHVTSVDQDFGCTKFLKETSQKLGFKNVRVIKYDAFKFVENTTEKFDIIFADPPYDLESASKLPEMVFRKELLKEGGWFILEQFKGKDFSKMPHFYDVRQYGNTGFNIFVNNKANE